MTPIGPTGSRSPSRARRSGRRARPTLNDSLDADTGGNGLHNYPVILQVLKAGSTVSVRGFAGPGTALEFFTSDGDATGFGEGERFVFSSVEGSGNDLDSGTGSYGPGAINGLLLGADDTNRFIVSGAAPAWLTTSDLITATATDAGGNTSEFSGVAPIDQHTIVKRTFSADGTPLTSGASAAKGAVVRFLLYVNNWGGAFTDLSVEDILDPGFEYVPGTIRTDTSVSACSVDGCTTPDEKPRSTPALPRSSQERTRWMETVSATPGVRSGSTPAIRTSPMRRWMSRPTVRPERASWASSSNVARHRYPSGMRHGQRTGG